MSSDKVFGGRDKSSQRGFHVGRTASVKLTIAPAWYERISLPLLKRPGRNDIGMRGKAEERCAAAAPCPEIGDASPVDVFTFESDTFEALANDGHASSVERGV